MYQNSQIIKATKKFLNRLRKQLSSAIKKQIIWLLRTFFITKKRRGSVNAGFVLPTVVMVSIVVVLLTAAILFRSFERSKNASNVRVNEVVLKSASPALDRAKAKINQLFQDPRLPRSTPTDFSLSQVINGNINQYTFGDETQLQLVTTTPVSQTKQTLQTAWKYPVDTNNNGKFDSYTIYGIYFLTPTTVRPRSSIEARTTPMDQGTNGNQCTSTISTSADLVGSQGWYKVGGVLERSIFVYTTTVPITDIKTPSLDGNGTKYEVFTGNQGFAALEYQQDRTRVPLTNNAVIFDNDLAITPGTGLNLNGRVFTNANLLTRGSSGAIRYYLVSSPASCYYTQANSKIVVAGNVVNSRVSESDATGRLSTQVDLYDQSYNASTLTSVSSGTIDDTNKSVPQATYGNTAGYNDQAYVRRIKRLIDATNAAYPNNTDLPDTVQASITSALATNPSLDPAIARNTELQIYFQQRTRRIPYAEVAFGGDPIGTYTGNTGSTSPLQRENSNALRPIDFWAFPFAPANGTTATGYAGIAIATNSTKKMYLTATDPAQQVNANKENVLGDRVLVGNNMPQYWYDKTLQAFVSSPTTGQTISGREWDYQQNGSTNSTVARQRYSQASQLNNLGITDRDNFWELSAAQNPTGPLDVVGGLRVVTGAGIYLPTGVTPTSTSAQLTTAKAQTTVWPDSMAMGVTNTTSGLPSSGTPYLQMRATAVYHYQTSSYNPQVPATYQAPIACVASYYDPTSSTTAKNRATDFGGNALMDSKGVGLTGVTGVDPDFPANTNNQSLNGIVYSASSLSQKNYADVLTYQASLKYPNGFPVNLPLQKALTDQTNKVNLSLSEQSAIDSALCALQILDGSIGAPTKSTIPHGTIRETSFLDARQIEAIDKPVATSQSNYDLDIELRQPLEIRATVLDLDALRKTATSNANTEYLFPNSGIIYATRDDALPDLSNLNGLSQTAALSDSTALNLSATDLVLDPNRRPNGIMLINGSDLSRYSTYNAAEKGLILASNLPVYIQGQVPSGETKGYFNKHTKQEFTQLNTWGTAFYQRKDLDSDFACRKDQFPACTTGETWRPATVIADAITVLSSNFKSGFRNDGDYNLRDNYGSFALGYDVNGGGISSSTTVSLNEQNLRIDLDGDGTINSATNKSYTEDQIPGTVAARLNGFWDNNFVTSRSFTDSQYSALVDADFTKNPQGSSYFNNFITPIQRRITFSEYLMEICPNKQIVTACNPSEWVVGYNLNGNVDAKGNGIFDDTVTINGNTYTENKIPANQLLKALADARVANSSFTFNKNNLWSGTTAQPAATDSNDSLTQMYPRRVAFLRYGNGLTVTKSSTALNASPITNALVLDSDNTPVPLGISSGAVRYFPYTNTLKINNTDYAVGLPSTASNGNALWFQTTGTTSATFTYNSTKTLRIQNTLTGTRATEQPLLAPVLQLQYPVATTAADTLTIADGYNTNWLQVAQSTETNVAFAQGNTPERPAVTGKNGENNGGLENFIRFLESWNASKDLTIDPLTGKPKNNAAATHTASGSFIQFKRSSYATAPFQTLINSTIPTTASIFGYPQAYTQSNGGYTGGSAAQGSISFYTPPLRSWGYDVALLTQLPDLFSQRFTSPSVGSPNEFYREVSRDDNWVKTLLCAAQPTTVAGGYDNAAAAYDVVVDAKTTINYKYALSSDQRPASCP